MTAPAGPPASTLTPGTDGPVWHALSADRVLQSEGVDGQRGLSSVEVVSRTERFGPNTFDTAKVESRWRAFARQYTDPMQVVLLVAGIVSLFLKEFETGVVLILLTLFNAVLGLRQEGKAAAAVTALQQMMIVKAKVIRDGQLTEIPAAELVPGDLVSIEAGDIVPADGRLLKAATLEVAESALTGESLPVSKGTGTVAGADTPLGDRTDMVYGSGCLVTAALLKGDKTRYPPAAGITPGRVATLRDRSNRMQVTSWSGRKGPHQLGLTAADQRTEPRRCGS